MTFVFSGSFDAFNKDFFSWLEFDLIQFLLFYLWLYRHWILNCKRKRMSLMANLVLPEGLCGSSYRSFFHRGGAMSSIHPISKWKEPGICFPVRVSTGSVCASEMYCCQGKEMFHPETAPTKFLVAVCSGDAFSITRNKGQMARTHTGISSLWLAYRPSEQLSLLITDVYSVHSKIQRASHTDGFFHPEVH